MQLPLLCANRPQMLPNEEYPYYILTCFSGKMALLYQWLLTETIWLKGRSGQWPHDNFGKAVVCPMAPTAVICKTQLCLNTCALGVETAWLFWTYSLHAWRQVCISDFSFFKDVVSEVLLSLWVKCALSCYNNYAPLAFYLEIIWVGGFPQNL